MTARRLVPVLGLILVVVSISALILIVPLIHPCSPEEVVDPRYEQFIQMAEEGRRAEALELGDRLFNALRAEEPDDETLALLAKRFDAATRIGTLVAGGVRSSQTKLLEGVVSLDDLGLAPPVPKGGGAPVTFLPPAREVYWTSLRAFTSEPASDGLSTQQTAFCCRYYDLRMQDSIMEIGRQVTVIDPNLSENACYAVVLPLLYLHGRDNALDQVESLLALFSPNQLDVLWRFSLLQAERPLASAQIARYQAKTAGKEFSLAMWALAAADACAANRRPDLAEKPVRIAIGDVKDRDAVAALRLKIAEGYARCGDYTTAARMCRQIADDLPDTRLYGKVKTIYFGYLARDTGAEQIITETESALRDARCVPYLTQILYLRWWALCKVNRQDEAAPIAQRLIEQDPDNPCVARVLLERATSALADQQYDKCHELLTRLTEDFPATESARRAREILTHLTASGIQ